MGIPHRLMKGRCQFCGRTLRYANIPNRGPVMAHAKGERQLCDMLRSSGRDLVSRNYRDAKAKAQRLGWGEGGYADGPRGESKSGWITPAGDVLDVAEVLAYVVPRRARSA